MAGYQRSVIDGLNLYPPFSERELASGTDAFEDGLTIFNDLTNMDFVDMDSGEVTPHGIIQPPQQQQPGQQRQHHRQRTNPLSLVASPTDGTRSAVFQSSQAAFPGSVRPADAPFGPAVGSPFPGRSVNMSPNVFHGVQSIPPFSPTAALPYSQLDAVSPETPINDKTAVGRRTSAGNTNDSSLSPKEHDAQRTAEEDKRRRNTAASARFRVKKKLREQAIERAAREMTERCGQLEAEINKLRMENEMLRDLVTDKIGGAAAGVATTAIRAAAEQAQDKKSASELRAVASDLQLDRSDLGIKTGA